MTRDAKGRFIPGNHEGGRKPRVAEEDFKALIDRVVTADDWMAILKKAVEQAKRGDSVARLWLTDRRYGKAPQPITGEKDNPINIRFVEFVRADETATSDDSE